MKLQGAQIAIVLRGVVDGRTIKTANALAHAGADVAIHAFTYNRASFQDERFVVVYHDPVEPQGSTVSSRPIRVLMNLTLKQMQKHAREKRMGVLGDKAVEKALREADPDIIHVVNADVLAGAARAAQALDIPFVYEAYEYWPTHALDPACSLTKGEEHALLDAEREFAPQATEFITVSEYLAQGYRKTLRLPRTPVVVYNAPVEYAKEPSRLHDPLRFLFLGNLQEERNIKALLEAFEGVSGATLTFQGSGRLEPWIRARIESKGLADRVKLVSPVPYDRLVSSLSHYDVGIVCHKAYDTQMEGALPNKFFEYIAGGLAVAVSDTEAFRGIPGLNSFGMLLDPSSSETIKNAMEGLVREKDTIEDMKCNALHAARTYCGDAQLQRIRDVYERIVAGM